MVTANSSGPAGVFEQYRRDVYGWAYRLLGRHHDALDAAQDVFLRWLRQSRRGMPKNPRGWLRQVTTNRAIDLLRVRRASTGADGAADRVVAPTDQDTIEKQELRGDVAAALETLTEAQRSVLIAKVYDGMTFAEIATEQNVAVPTVKTHYLRALRTVRDRLAKRWGPERNEP